MSDPVFRVAVRAAEGGVQVELVGELDVSTAPELRRHVDDIVSARGDVLVDCAELTFADSSGLDTLIRLAKALREQNRRLVLSNVRPMVQRAMEVLQITDLFQLEEK
jgi:anti-anti-sigma factor